MARVERSWQQELTDLGQAIGGDGEGEGRNDPPQFCLGQLGIWWCPSCNRETVRAGAGFWGKVLSLGLNLWHLVLMKYPEVVS